jgi:acyl dehydratase
MPSPRGERNDRELYLEDLHVGQTFHSTKSHHVTQSEALAFAGQFDPQPFHLDEKAAAESFFGRLALSGWHTASVTMRLFVESDLRLAGGLIGVGVDSLIWPRPSFPDDSFRLEIEVVHLRPLKSRPDQGIVKLRNRTLNQRDEVAQEVVVNVLARRRPTS